MQVDLGVVQGLARGASRIVSQAAQILEEELSAGIGVAKQIEKRLLNVAEMRSADPDEVMARFRVDAHEVVDIVLDVIDASTRSLGGIGSRISVGDGEGRSGAQAGGNAPTIALPESVSPGSAGAAPFSLENEGETVTAEFVFQATDLVNAEGKKIPARQVTFDPPKLSIPANERQSVTVKVAVPATAKPGTYSGLVLASNLDRLRAVLVVNVE